MILSDLHLEKFSNQHKAIKNYIDDLPPEAIYNRLTEDKFSIHETIAYLTRYHYIFLSRLIRMKNEINPYFEVYKPAEDPEFKFSAAKTTGSLLHELYRLRTEILTVINQFPDEYASRVATHSVLGRMNLTQWFEFFLLHESSQLFKIFKMAGTFWTTEHNNLSNIIYLPRLSNYMDELVG